MKKYLKWTIFIVLLIVVIMLGLNYLKEDKIEKEEMEHLEKNTYIKESGTFYKKDIVDIIFIENVTDEQIRTIEEKYDLKRTGTYDEIVYHYKFNETIEYEEFKIVINNLNKEDIVEVANGIWDLSKSTNKD